MKITVDTNVLLRVILRDDPDQACSAEEALSSASLVAIPLPCLCEVVWVLDRSYGINRAEIALVLESLLNAPNVATNRAAVDAGLSILKAGGDFADGVIAYEGAWLGGETFVSFDKRAVTALAKQGRKAKLLG
ncbi:MAG: type II toxin-antitoxin system VapC family toxin [Terracidiphilus sp.]|jgi:predicted nucleic-acid-binding protein